MYGSPQHLVYSFWVHQENAYDHENDLSFPWSPWFMKTANPIGVDSSRFIKINPLYQGPFKKEDGTFASGEDDFFAETFDIPIEIEAPLYTTPSAVCNKINLILHRTEPQEIAMNELPQGSKTGVTTSDHNYDAGPAVQMIHLNGKMFRCYSANGYVMDDNQNPFWGQIAVQDINKWYAIHYGMRMDLAVTNVHDEDVHYPIYFLGTMRIYPSDSTGLIDTDQFPYSEDAFEGNIATMPKNFLISTNVAYTEDNLKRFAKFFPKIEQYVGEATDITDANKNTNMWYCDLDIGRTKDANNSTDTLANNTSWSPNYTSMQDVVDGIPIVPSWVKKRLSPPSPLTNKFRVYSRYISNWKTIIRTSNCVDSYEGNPKYAGDGRYSGYGYYDSLDDSLSKKYNLGVFPYMVEADEGSGDFHLVCAFMLQTGTAKRDNDTNTWTYPQSGTDAVIKCSAMDAGYYAIASPSSMDNPYGLLWNKQTSTNIDLGNEHIPEHVDEFINFVNIGADNPTIEFDDTQSRCTLSNLHTARKLGVNEVIFESSDEDTVIGYNIGQVVAKINDANFPGGRFNETDQTADPNVFNPRNYSISDALSGVYLDAVYLQGDNPLITGGDDENAILANSTNFRASLLYKLGFRYKDLFTDFGTLQARHNQDYEYDYSLENRYKSVKPLTTNSYLNISDATSLSTQDGTYDSTSTGHSQPDYQLGYVGFQQVNLDGSTSSQIIASNLPTRLDTSFYLIYSNICNSDYNQEDNKLSCVGVVPRNYSAGDFLVSFGDNSFGQIINNSSRQLTNIRTEIRLSTGELAPLNPKSSILYRIVKPYVSYGIQENPENVLIEQLKKQNTKMSDMITLLTEIFKKK